jgi:hypothetical protein
MTRLFAALFMICAAIVALPGDVWAQGNCRNNGSTTLNAATIANLSVIGPFTVTATPAYDPFGGTDLTFNFTLTVQNNTGRTCGMALILQRSSAPVVMTNTPITLSYGVEFGGTNAVAIAPALFGWFANVAPGGTFTYTYTMRIPASQTSSAAGAYTDTQITLFLYAFQNGWHFVRTHAMTFNATINKTCTMSAPSPASLNFTSAISQGVPNPGVVLSSTFTNVNCTFPAKVRLDGTAMQRTPAIGAISGLDNFINWQAQAIFGSANVTLNTSSASTATSAGDNVASGTTVAGSFSVNVNLLAGQPLQEGTYTGNVAVTVDPTL